MKISQTPTDHILVKAHCDSEWDYCDFAIIDCGEGWAELFTQRLKALRSLHEDGGFFSAQYMAGEASFHVSDYEKDDILPEDKDWAFVEIEEDELDNLPVPKSRLDGQMAVVYSDGSVRYQAYAKNGNEEYFTDDIPLEKIVELMQQ